MSDGDLYKKYEYASRALASDYLKYNTPITHKLDYKSKGLQLSQMDSTYLEPPISLNSRSLNWLTYSTDGSYKLESVSMRKGL